MQLNILELEVLLLAVREAAKYRYDGDNEKWLDVSIEIFSELGIGHIPLVDIESKLIQMISEARSNGTSPVSS